MEDGALLPSPTRDKLMPTIPKSKEDESYNSQRGSPKKSAVSRHGSPQKGSPQKQSIQKKTIKQSKHQIRPAARPLEIQCMCCLSLHRFVLTHSKQIDRNRLGRHRQMPKAPRNGKLVQVALHRLPRLAKLPRKHRSQHQLLWNGVLDQVS